jgi:peroxiredoxin
MFDAFEARDIVVIAVAQEDKDLEGHAKFRQHFQPEPRFELAADFDKTDTKRYERTSTYLIDKTGVVRQVFPQMVHHRATWKAILNEADGVLPVERGAATRPDDVP